jgi:hypothetical protein
VSQEEGPESGDAQDGPSAPTEADVLAAGRLVPYSMLPDWVPLSGISPPAQALYWQLALHIAHGRGDRVVFPSRGHLARRLSFRQARSVDRYIDELVEIGAIDKYTGRAADRMRTRNYYVLHMAPSGATTASGTRFSGERRCWPLSISPNRGPRTSWRRDRRPVQLAARAANWCGGGDATAPRGCVPTPRRL